MIAQRQPRSYSYSRRGAAPRSALRTGRATMRTPDASGFGIMRPALCYARREPEQDPARDRNKPARRRKNAGDKHAHRSTSQRTGVTMTRGHEDSMIIGRVRQKVAGLPESARIHVAHLHKAEPPLLARRDIRGIHQRVDARGNVLVDLDLGAVERAVDELVADGIEALAVSFLWSFVNPEHERRIKALVEQRHPQLFLTISSDLISVLGEYERTVSTCLNSYS